MRSISRRRLLLGGAATAALAGAGSGIAVVSRGGGSKTTAAMTPTPAATVTAGTAATPEPPRGGVARVHAPASFNFDTFDALKSGEPSVVEVLGRTHARLVDWLDPDASVIGPGLAAAWEQPAADRLVLRLEPAFRWQPGHPLAGERIQPDQVRSFLRRAVDLARAGRMPAAQRPQDWARIRNVSTPGDVVSIQTDGPDPFLLQTLASRFALFQAPEAVQAFEATWHELRPQSARGCGAFIYDGQTDATLRFAAHDAGPGRPYLDGIELSEPADVAERFIAGALDEAILRDRREAPAVRARYPGAIAESARFEESPVTTTLFIGAPPWNNLEMRLALNGALNRGELGRRLFGGRAAVAGPVSPALPAFALPESELLTSPGYRADVAADFGEARKRWEASGGPALGPITVDIPAIFDPLYSASAVVTGMLREALGAEVRVRVDTYAAISARAAAHEYGNGNAALWFGWGPTVVEPDPSRYLLETFWSRSASYGTTGYRSTPLDLACERMATLTDVSERKENVKHVQRLLQADASGGVISWLQQRGEVVRHPYYTAAPASPFWTQHRSSQAAINPAHPSYENRSE